MSLTQLQEHAIQALLAVPLKRNCYRSHAKNRGRIRGEYRLAATAMGYTPEQIEQQLQDVRDMVALTLGVDDDSYEPRSRRTMPKYRV